MTQVGRRLIRKVWKWAKPSGVEARLWKDMGSRGMNHDITQLSLPSHHWSYPYFKCAHTCIHLSLMKSLIHMITHHCLHC